MANPLGAINEAFCISMMETLAIRLIKERIHTSTFSFDVLSSSPTIET
jgi:hypothetical protein